MFVCFVLEHLSRPVEALADPEAGAASPGGTITVIEGDHGSAYFHPQSAAAQAAIQCLIDLQADAGGDSLIGRRVYPLMVGRGLRRRAASRRAWSTRTRAGRRWSTASRCKTFTAMVAGVREDAIAAGMLDAEAFDAGIRDLERTAEADGTFSYTFFKGVGGD